MSKTASRLIFHVYSDTEIRKLGDRYLSKFEYDNVNGYAVRFSDAEKNRFFSLTQYDTMASAKRAAVTYRNKLLRAGEVATAPEWKGRKGSADFVPLQMPGDKRLKHLIAALELLEQAGLEIVGQASLFLHVAMEADVTLPKLLDGPFGSKTSLKENLRKLSQDFPESNGRSAYGLFERHGRGRRNPFVYELSDKGRGLVDALINSQPGRKRLSWQEWRTRLILFGITATKMAKSVLYSGWGMLKTQLEYKCAHAGCVFLVVDESNTTQTCSSCGAKPDSGPKGIAGLGIRGWTCDECGVTHDRDVNAAKNILALGHERLAGEKVAA